MKFSEFLQEVRMNPKSLQSFAASSDLRVGFEFEVIFDDAKHFVGDADMEFGAGITLQAIAKFFGSRLSDAKFDRIEDEYRQYKATTSMSSFYGFLMRNGIEDYEQFADEYDLDLPDGYEEYGPDRWMVITRKIATKFAEDLNVKMPNIHDEHNAKEKDFSKWTLEPDSSIQGNHGVELVSPVYSSITEGINQLKKVFAWLHENKVKTNSSCGLHINISGDKHFDLDFIKMVLFLGDEHLLKEFGRDTSHFCESMFRNLNGALARDPKFVEKMMSALKDDMAKWAKRNLSFRRDLGKYVSVNLKKGQVEVRSVGGDYLRQEEKVTNAVLRVAQAYAVATDPTAEAEEYNKKFYKLITTHVKGDESSDKIMKLFARYAAGNFDEWNTKEMIKKKIAKFQTQRKTGEKPGPWPFE